MRVLSYFSLLLLQYAMGDLSRLPCESECASSTHCSPTFWGATIAQSRARSAGCEVILYTVSTEPNTRRIVPGPADNVGCNIAFVAEGTVQNSSGFAGWTLVFVNSTDSLRQFPDVRKASRVPKLSPGLFFADSVKYAVYTDNLVLFKVPIRQLIKRSTAPPGSGREVVMAAMRHPFVNSLEREYKLIESLRPYRKRITHQWDVLQKQFGSYMEYQKTHPNLTYDIFLEGSVLVHNMRSPLSKKWRCDWYEEYNRWSDRDQVAAGFMVGKLFYEATNGTMVDPSQAKRTKWNAGKLVDGFVPIYAKEEAAAALFLFPRGQARAVMHKQADVSPTTGH